MSEAKQTSNNLVSLSDETKGKAADDVPPYRRVANADQLKQPASPVPPVVPADSVPKAPAKADRAPNNKKGARKAMPDAPVAKPTAQPAHLRKRHWGLFASFFLLVAVPSVLAALYLWFVAEDQYASTAGFTVRQEESGASASDLIGGLSQFTGAGTSADSDILYEFIQSQEIVQKISDQMDLGSLFSKNWEADPVFSLWPDATIEDLLWFWQRTVRISYDQATGLIEVRVLSHDPILSQELAGRIMAESQIMINALNTASRSDTMKYAISDLDEALARLKEARSALTAFRSRTQIVDPLADLQSRMGVMSNLQQQLAESLISLDLLTETTGANDARVRQAERRISVIRDRIADERASFAAGEVSPDGEDYPQLLAAYESLTVDLEFAEQIYRTALTALELARSNAQRQTRYLAAYVEPTRAQSAEYPQRLVLSALIVFFLLMSWSVGALVYYSLRDRR